MHRFLAYYRLSILVFVFLPTLFLTTPVQAQDTPDTSSALPAAQSDLPAAPTVVNEDGYTTWRLEVHSGCVFSDHKYTFNLPEDPQHMADIRMTMDNFDVDYFDPQECKGGPEFDNASLNGQDLGILAGANNQWSLNSWTLTRDRLKKGANTVFIDTDATGTGCWCVGVGYIEIQAKVGFQIVSTTPVENDRNRDFHADKLDLTVTFSNDLNPATVTKETVKVHTNNSAGQPQFIDGTFTFPAPNKLLFKPSADLLDGVRYYITVFGGPTGVKNKDDVPLDATRTWTFWTVPNLDRSDSFDYGDGRGSRCPPSTSPCAGLEIAVFQVARNATMVPNKDTVARLYLRWRRHSGIRADDQLNELSVNVSMDVTPGGGSYSTVQTVRRPDFYTDSQITNGVNTLNIYHKPASGFTYNVRVIPQPQTNATTIVFNATRSLANLGSSPTISFDHYFLKDGAWLGGVPGDIKTGAATYLAGGAQLVLDMFPAIAANAVIKGDITIGYTYTGNNVVYGSCGTVREVNCRVGLVDVRMPEAQCIHNKLSTMLGGNKIVSISVPQNVCTNSGGVAIGRVLMLVPTTNPVVVPHEVGHAYDISKANNPNDGHRNDPTGIEGFQVRTKTNRSRTENILAAESLMHTGPVANPGSQWTHNGDYTTLLGTVTAAQVASVDAGPYLMVSGLVDVGDGSAEVAPLTLQDTPIESNGTGVCAAQLLDGASAVLSNASFTPGVEVHTFLTSDSNQQETFVPESPSQEGPQSFVLTLPWNENAQKLRISCNDTPLFTQNRSAALPSVDFTGLANGATLTGNVAINWTGNDGDSATLFYQLQFSDDNGASWSLLTAVAEATTYSLDTTILPSGEDHKLRVLVTDGFNTAYAERSVDIDNPLILIGEVPPDFGENIPLGSTMQAVFNTPIDSQTLSEQSFTIEGPGNPYTVTGNLSADGRTVTFQPEGLLEPDSYYTVRVRETLKDVSGNSVPFGDSWSFHTISDTVPPLIEYASPFDGELNVPLNAMVSVQFNEDLAFGVVQENFSLVDDQGQAVAGLPSTTFDSNQIIVFKPDQLLKPKTLYKATLSTGITDENGNALEKEFVWTFTTGASETSDARIIGNYNEKAEDIDDDGLYDTLTIYVDVQSFSGFYYLNARLLDQEGNTIQWVSSDFGDENSLFPDQLNQGIHRLALIFDGQTIRAHQKDGPYFLDAVIFYTDSFFEDDIGANDQRFLAYQTLPYSVTEFSGVLSFSPLPDRIIEWNTTLPDAWNLLDYTRSFAVPKEEVTYSIIGNTDPRVGVTIDANNSIDINPEPGVATQSIVTIEARDSEGNRGEGSFLVDVQKPKAEFMLVPMILVLPPNQEHKIEVEIQDQFEHLFTSGEAALTITNTLESATVSPLSVNTTTGRATFTYSPAATSEVDIVSIRLEREEDFDVVAEIQIVIGEKAMFVPFVRAIPVPE